MYDATVVGAIATALQLVRPDAGTFPGDAPSSLDLFSVALCLLQMDE